MDKASIRQSMRIKRRALSRDEKASADSSICRKLAARLRGLSPVAVYMSSRDEIDLTALISQLLKSGVALVAPRWNGSSYDLAQLEGIGPDDLRKGPMGILEPRSDIIVPPSDVAAWVVPGLAFSKDGRRIGYGGGWYDRLLSGAAADAPRIGVAYSFQVVESLPAEHHDVLLTEVVDEA